MLGKKWNELNVKTVYVKVFDKDSGADGFRFSSGLIESPSPDLKYSFIPFDEMYLQSAYTHYRAVKIPDDSNVVFIRGTYTSDKLILSGLNSIADPTAGYYVKLIPTIEWTSDLIKLVIELNPYFILLIPNRKLITQTNFNIAITREPFIAQLVTKSW